MLRRAQHERVNPRFRSIFPLALSLSKGEKRFLRQARGLHSWSLGMVGGGRLARGTAATGRIGHVRGRPRVCALAAGVTLALMGWSVGATAQGDGLRIDAATCNRIQRAAALVRGDYLTLPPRHEARSFPVVDVRRLFGAGERGKTRLVKKSLAEENPVLCTGGAPGAAEIVDGIWRPPPGASPGRAVGGEGNGCPGAVVVVGYDDARSGGAFEVMKNCEAESQGERFFWVRYDDVDDLCRCAVEVVGRRGGAASQSELAGSLRFENAAGAVMPAQRQWRGYRLERAYPSGTRFRVRVTSNGPAYVYVFASDLTRRIYPVFPQQGGSAHLAYRENHVAIPDEESYLQLDERPGTDYFCALYSTRKLDFSMLVRRIEETQGDFASRLQAVLGEDVMPEADVRYASAGEMGFTAKSPNGSAVPVIVEIDHAR